MGRCRSHGNSSFVTLQIAYYCCCVLLLNIHYFSSIIWCSFSPHYKMNVSFVVSMSNWYWSWLIFKSEISVSHWWTLFERFLIWKLHQSLLGPNIQYLLNVKAIGEAWTNGISTATVAFQYLCPWQVVDRTVYFIIFNHDKMLDDKIVIVFCLQWNFLQKIWIPPSKIPTGPLKSWLFNEAVSA